ncbi:MAG: hypothetical protein NC541_03855 [bacterium]|nr:hypothetical protein [bacterium]MCM1500053.1 hypothetical protein [Clostridium sp.]
MDGIQDCQKKQKRYYFKRNMPWEDSDYDSWKQGNKYDTNLVEGNTASKMTDKRLN